MFSFCRNSGRNSGWIMENMDKTHCTKIVWPKIPQMSQNLFAQFVCPSPKVLDFNEKRLYWTSVKCVHKLVALLLRFLLLRFRHSYIFAIFCQKICILFGNGTIFVFGAQSKILIYLKKILRNEQYET